MRPLLLCLSFVLASLIATPVAAQDSPIPVASGPTDAQVADRLNGIYAQLSDTQDVTVSVQDSVVTLSGQAANTEAAERAVSIAMRVDGVVAVQDNIERTLAVTDNVSPLLIEMRDLLSQLIRALPLIAAALFSLIVIILFGRWLAARNKLIKKFAKNPFLVELIGTAIKLAFIVIGLVVALNILGATALIGTVLGGAGIIGIALGFGIRDTVENYIASLLLSIRQPFRAQDHVVIDGQRGIVVRLNTRATILMTLDGNHLRIPNAKVFKADILNYTTNPERRFSFRVGVDSADDPVAAIRKGVKTLSDLDFILDEPGPSGTIVELGDSAILIDFFAWIDQRETGFGAARSQAIRDVKDMLEENGFSLPEPLYRLRVEGGTPLPVQSAPKATSKLDKPTPVEMVDETLETGAELVITERVARERAELSEDTDAPVDLLDDSAERE